MVAPEIEKKFLEEHKNADVLVVDTETRRVVAAEYTTCRGVPRIWPVRFWIDGTSENM